MSPLRASLLTEFPFPVCAIQVGRGSDFMAEFELRCAQYGIELFALPPRSRKLNGSVQRAHHTHREEFYGCIWVDPTVVAPAPVLAEWITTYNTERPHQALDCETSQDRPTAWNANNDMRQGRVSRDLVDEHRSWKSEHLIGDNALDGPVTREVVSST